MKSTKTLVIIILMALFGLGGAYAVVQSPTNAEEIKQAGPPLARDDEQSETLVIQDKKGEKHSFTIEVARTPQEQAYGLMNRNSMEKNHGMLFLFPAEDERSFWMKNTLIPLDMLFIKADGTIHNIHDSAIPHDLTPINSRGPVLAVLELNGGRAAELGIKPGDRVFYRAFDHSP